MKEGDQVMVKVINVDPSGKIRLSRKALIAPPEGAADGAPEGAGADHGRGGRHQGNRPRHGDHTPVQKD
jgi:polyribonucleotide nucleotidyltransferase